MTLVVYISDTAEECNVFSGELRGFSEFKTDLDFMLVHVVV